MQLVCAFALVALLASGWAQTRVGAPAPGRLPGTWPATIDGVEVGGEAEARFRLQAATPGTVVPFEAAGQRGFIPVFPAYGLFHHVVTFVTGLLFWAACVVAFAARAGTEPARTFLWASLGYALAIMAGDVHFPGRAAWPNAVFPLARMFALLATPVLFLRIAFIFPRPDRRVRGDLIVLAVAVVAAVLFAWEAGRLLDYVAGGGAEAFARLGIARRTASAFLAALVLGGSVYLVRTTRRAVLARERRQVKWVAWGSVVGAIPYALFYALPQALGLQPVLPVDVVRLFSIAVPLSYGIAVARHQFMDIDLIIRRSLIYGAMAALLTVAYLVAGLALGARSTSISLDTQDALRILAAGAAVALFAPTRNTLGRWVDGAFFHLRSGYRRDAGTLRAELAGAADPARVIERLTAGVRDALGARSVEVAVDPEQVGSGHNGDGPRPPGDALAAAVARLLADSPRVAVSAPEATVQPELERPGWPGPLERAGVVLVQPLVADTGPQGALLLGPKVSERRYVEEDLAFLAEVATDAGRALERLHLAHRAAEESFLRARQAELDRRKTAFLTQVAHDLRTPLTSILWSSQNVLDGVRGPVGGDVGAEVRSMRAAAAHLGRLVDNLLEVARLDGDGPRAPLERFDARPIVEEALLALAPVARAREVTLECRLDADTPAVWGRREGLSRIVLNLVENAIKFSPAGGRVEVTLERDAGGGAAVLAVRDHGPGVPEEEREVVFERFRQGGAADRVAGSGIGVGFGVGLSVVREWVGRFGGTIGITAPAGGGARFACRLRTGNEPERGGEAWPAS
jgi:signal transduction histidine kinase